MNINSLISNAIKLSQFGQVVIRFSSWTYSQQDVIQALLDQGYTITAATSNRHHATVKATKQS